MKILTWIVLVILIAASMVLLRPDPDRIDGGFETSLSDEGNEPAGAGSEASVSDYEERYAAMQSEFDRLAESRRALKKRLDRLKHELWGIALPADQAKSINESMLTGFKALKTPKMLGAFSSVREIRDEIDRVESVNRKLDRAQERIGQAEKRN